MLSPFISLDRWIVLKPEPGRPEVLSVKPGVAPKDVPEAGLDAGLDPALDDTDSSPFLLCAACGFRVTRQGWRLSVDGKATHVFFNPAGLVFELGCFSAAPGCACVGEASMEFTWFGGYAWRVALCRNCAVHLGWRYESGAVGTGFFGLILDALVEDRSSGERAH